MCARAAVAETAAGRPLAASLELAQAALPSPRYRGDGLAAGGGSAPGVPEAREFPSIWRDALGVAFVACRRARAAGTRTRQMLVSATVARPR